MDVTWSKIEQANISFFTDNSCFGGGLWLGNQKTKQRIKDS